jgi:hypothetical protein
LTPAINKQLVLEKAIQKAIDGGWEAHGVFRQVEFLVDEDMALLVWYDYGDEATFLGFRSENDVIFNHDFAKALWGERKVDRIEELPGRVKTYYKTNSGWHYHLQQMVIAEDPIKYLGENI